MADNIRRAEYGLHNKKIEIEQPNIDTTASEGNTNTFYLGERYIEDFSEVEPDEKTDKDGNKYYYDNAKKQTVAVSKTDGTIFDKSTNATSTNKINENEFVEKTTKKEGEKTTEEVVKKYLDFDPTNTASGLYRTNDRTEDTIFDKSKQNTATNKIDENTSKNEKNEKTYLDFDPTNTTSGLYRGTYENTYSVEEATKTYTDGKGTNKTYYPGSEYRNNTEVNNDNYDKSKITVNNNKSPLNKNINTDRTNNYINLKDFYNSDNVGATPWDGENDFNAIATNVDMQDELLLDDIEDSSDLSKLGKATANSFKNLQNTVGVVKDAKSLVNGFKSKKDPEFTSNRPGSPDNDFTKLAIAKSEKYKNIKMSSKLGTYNSLANLLGTASGMMVGSLGKSVVSNVIDDMTSKFVGGFGITGIAERLSGTLEAMPSAEEIVALNLANYYNMYSARPGRVVTDRYHKYNFITPNGTDNIDGTRNSSSKTSALEKIQNITNKVSNGINAASSWVDGSKISGLVSKKAESIEDVFDIKGGGSYIISPQRVKHESHLQYNKSNAYLTDIVNTAAQKLLTNDSRLSKDVLGGLYVEPYYNSYSSSGDKTLIEDSLKQFLIPFQFNPVINDGGYEAKYQTEELMGRLLQVRSYIGTNSNTVTLETKYLITAADDDSDNVDYLNDFNKKEHYIKNNWMKNWNSKKLYEIERQYRKLVLPFIKSDQGIFVRPPIVRIQFGYNNEKNNLMNVSTLFNYHDTTDCFEVTKTLGEATSEKRYIVTNLQINPIDQNGFDYYIDYSSEGSSGYLSYRRGFTVNLTLAETTKNFLDTVPNYYNYSKAVSKSFSISKPNIENPELLGSNKPSLQDIFKLNYFEFSKEKAIDDILNTFSSTTTSTDTTTSADTNTTSALKMLEIEKGGKEIIKRNFDNSNDAFIVKIYNNK